MTTAIDDMVTNPVQPRSESVFFGQVVTVDRSDWKLVKGQGRVAFDESYDDPATRVRGITIVIECEKRGGDKFTIDTGRQPLLEIDKAWHKHLLPSLQKTGALLSSLRLRFCQVKRVPTGDTYTNASGEIKEKTALEFVAFYDDWHAMNAARTAMFGQTPAAASAPPVQAPAATAPQVDRAQLEKLFPALWQASGRDQAVFLQMFENNPTLSAAFTRDEALQYANIPF